MVQSVTINICFDCALKKGYSSLWCGGQQKRRTRSLYLYIILESVNLLSDQSALTYLKAKIYTEFKT